MIGTLHCNRCHISIKLIDNRVHTNCPSCKSPHIQIYKSNTSEIDIKKDLNSTITTNKYDFKRDDNQNNERRLKMKNTQKEEFGAKVLKFLDELDENLSDKDKRKILSVPYKALKDRINSSAKKKVSSK